MRMAGDLILSELSGPVGLAIDPECPADSRKPIFPFRTLSRCQEIFHHVSCQFS